MAKDRKQYFKDLRVQKKNELNEYIELNKDLQSSNMVLRAEVQANQQTIVDMKIVHQKAIDEIRKAYETKEKDYEARLQTLSSMKQEVVEANNEWVQMWQGSGNNAKKVYKQMEILAKDNDLGKAINYLKVQLKEALIANKPTIQDKIDELSGRRKVLRDENSSYFKKAEVNPEFKSVQKLITTMIDRKVIKNEKPKRENEGDIVVVKKNKKIKKNKK